MNDEEGKGEKPKELHARTKEFALRIARKVQDDMDGEGRRTKEKN
jgi:hypothetical protein